MAQCPTCMNYEHELIAKDGDEFTCHACGTVFDKAGKPIPPEPKKKVPKPVPKPAPKRVVKPVLK